MENGNLPSRWSCKHCIVHLLYVEWEVVQWEDMIDKDDIDIDSWAMVNGLVVRSGPESKKHGILTTRISRTEVYRWTLALGTKSKNFCHTLMAIRNHSEKKRHWIMKLVKRLDS